MKMHTLSCKELGSPVCDYVATGGSDADVKWKMLDHASKEHPETVNTPADKDALGRRIDRVLEDKADGSELDEAHGEDESQGGEFLDDDSARSGRAKEREATQHARGAGEGRDVE
jgi:predicted small metal-binding protein